MATLKIILDKRTKRSDGTYSINFQICHNRKTTTRSSKICVLESEWDDGSKTIRKSNPDHKLLNIKLKKSFADLQSGLLLADDQKVEEVLKPQPAQLKKTEVKKTVYDFASELIHQLKTDKKIGNAWVYESTVNALKGFHPENNLYFESIDYQFLTKYNSHLVKKEIKHNTIYLYVRTLRIFYNKAIKTKLVDRLHYPFHDFKLRPEKTRKRAVDKEILQKLTQLDINEGAPQWHSRNYFKLSFCLIGISIVDLCLLTKDNINNGRLTYKRRKTGKWYDIKLQPEAINILAIYQGYSKYLLPIADHSATTEERLIKCIKYKTKVINKHLAQLVKELKVDVQITTYTARHSWATIAKKAGYSIELIAEALGHEYGNRITAVYLDNFDPQVIDEANEQVIAAIF